MGDMLSTKFSRKIRKILEENPWFANSKAEDGILFCFPFCYCGGKHQHNIDGEATLAVGAEQPFT